MKTLHSFKFLTVKVQTVYCWYIYFVSSRFPCKLIFSFYVVGNVFPGTSCPQSSISVNMLVPGVPELMSRGCHLRLLFQMTEG